MDVITSPPLLPPPAFVPHSGDDIRYGYAMTTIRCARAILGPSFGGILAADARLSASEIQTSIASVGWGRGANCPRTFTSGAAPSMASPFPCGHPALVPSAAGGLAIQCWFASIQFIGGSDRSPLVRRRDRQRSHRSSCKPCSCWRINRGANSFASVGRFPADPDALGHGRPARFARPALRPPLAVW
ncbi:hypothetical protein LF1_08900 [Rubripirellula obstinata]|uniref:Uncharacterized protein n=1 Tax=Rubripirellula obstinata TaxID=406547 RepID=A0A5B1CDS8_9BACT|nr:hypothetical protein LF1_08900 [Rubripirellula obstinata]